MDTPSITREHYDNWRRVLTLSIMDFKRSYRGAIFGWLWLVLKPMILLSLYAFIVYVGFKADHGDKAYSLAWLVTGLAAWFFMSDMITAGLGAFRKYRFLVSKIKFPVSTIPTILTISNLITHLLLLGIVMILLGSQGFVSIYWIQLPIYIALSLTAMWLWSLLAAPLGAMSRDFTQIVKSLMRILVWISGILWNAHAIEIDWIRKLVAANPIHFIVEGYRQSLIGRRWLFEDWQGLLLFIIQLIILGLLAALVFKRNRKELADII